MQENVFHYYLKCMLYCASLSTYYSLYTEECNSVLIFCVIISKSNKSLNKAIAKERNMELKHLDLIMNK